MTTIEEKTPIVYRVSSRSRRDVPEHQSKSRKRTAAEAGITDDFQQTVHIPSLPTSEPYISIDCFLSQLYNLY